MTGATGGGAFDLHTHSVFSDGTTRPADIAREAAELGLAGFALTDHDTIDGWSEAREAARRHGVGFLPGIEITTKHDWHSRHLLAYGIDPAAGELFEALAEVRGHRLGRAREMVRRIAADYAITWEAVVGAEDARTVGRPHIADALVAAGYFADRSAAFADVLHPGSPYYIGTYALETVDAIRLVRAAGGVPVLAHPAASRQRGTTSRQEMREFAAAGLWGAELDHPENRAEWLPPLRRAAAELALETTGASDYHGAGKPNRLGERSTQAALVERLRELVVTPR
ncbi:PHP domain-containing protein [Leucobacter sp. wl10]|uniref:PHP domain-containing protein n=1 Tax=Leucobacter sp. wl10 TaxID=2304677 RepID=UPI000E5B0D7F|nr:PHP domain-containing protein [Leucobacter sp. wl10]RGE21590.1 PHP domain-containing protein [Leucobacter sp. wl10]